jgi:hypothetical protein
MPGHGAAETESARRIPSQQNQSSSGIPRSAGKQIEFAPSIYRAFADWKAACDRLSSNRSMKRALPSTETLPLKTFRQLEEVLDAFLDLCKGGTLAQTNAWVGNVPARSEFFNTDKLYFKHGIPFQPFAQKLSISPNAEVLLHGDLHGDIRTLISWIDWLNKQGYLDDFRLIRPETYIIFLGDYTDRGWYGVEVLYTLFRLKLANPDHVFLLRGNHEDVSLATTYGFFAETRLKYGREFNMDKVLRTFDFFPVAIYLGCKNEFVQCNHGGMEPGFSPQALLEADGAIRFQLLDQLNQARFREGNRSFLDQLDPGSKRVAQSYLQDFRPKSPVAPTTLGFMWNDFSLVKGEAQLAYDPGRAFVYGDRATGYILDKSGTATNRVRAVFRAHQHSGVLNPMMRRLKASRGIFRHWQDGDSLELLDADETRLTKTLERSGERSIAPNSVWTFNVAPDSVYGEGCAFDFDTFGILKVAERFEDWKLAVTNLPSSK